MNFPPYAVLNGLPGEGPKPIHYHSGTPAPWREDLVVQFENRFGWGWIGNFRWGDLGETQIFDWPESDAFCVVAKGALYLLSAIEPSRYVTNPAIQVQRAFLAPERDVLILLAEPEVVAYGKDLALLWQVTLRSEINLEACVDGVLTLETLDGWGQPATMVRLDLRTGRPLR